MQHELLNYFKLIGEINNIILKSNSFDDVYKQTLKLMVDSSSADYAVIWYKDGNKTLRPSYFLCPIDISNKSFKCGEGVIGKVFETSEPKIISDFSNNKIDEIYSMYSDIRISSYVCVPLNDGDENVGAIEFIKEKGSFNDEEINIFELIPTLVSIQIKNSDKFNQIINDKEVLFTIRDVKKSFVNGEFVTNVLKGINLDIYKGEFVVLLGQSGCGKSTLLNIVGGMDTPDSGSILFRDIDLASANEKQLTLFRRNNVGFIFQSYNLMPNLNIKENLDLIAELVKEPLDSAEALKLVGLQNKMRNYPSQLSGGQQQRVSIARALVKQPTIIMADEPTAALDYSTSIEVLSSLSNVCKCGTTLLMVTHNEEIAKMADRVVKLRDGKVFEISVNRHPFEAKDLVW